MISLFSSFLSNWYYNEKYYQNKYVLTPRPLNFRHTLRLFLMSIVLCFTTHAINVATIFFVYYFHSVPIQLCMKISHYANTDPFKKCIEIHFSLCFHVFRLICRSRVRSRFVFDYIKWFKMYDISFPQLCRPYESVYRLID